MRGRVKRGSNCLSAPSDAPSLIGRAIDDHLARQHSAYSWFAAAPTFRRAISPRMVRAETGTPPRVRSRPPASEHRQRFVDHGYRVCADGHGEESNCREPGGSDQGGHGEVVRHQDPPHPFAIRQLRTDPLSLETQRVGALLHLKVFRPQRLRAEWGLAVLTPSTRFAVLTGHATSLRVLSCRKQLRNLLVRAIFIAVGQEFESP